MDQEPFKYVVRDSLNWLDKNPDFVKKNMDKIKVYSDLLGKDKKLTDAVLQSLKEHPALLLVLIQYIEQTSNPSKKLLAKGSSCK
ncbi:hypothetical protein Mpet_2532 [Methanolacinia petrolearia DSM 11571]|uniref:Uncharacterized protein n=1 Tax=Methanolacinia petrolearia (strain DSM 11571 / OCM 486 / SEBR 4847) TaxID=679926 RepID=E1RF32_METP4|nr:hypothetical protein [Methanolacinia petrolearia]ADN37276.1 hypothetical protein Mpet_2532 [Methanolacinia petrolearia DSM 11571]